uniref:DDE Tnp4 domain-containing protein n=1 Tax=Oreochromis aureus TaxID=47969 RepID=A0AAZ1XAG0_OREAU
RLKRESPSSIYCGEQSSGVKDVLAVPGSIRSSRGVSSLFEDLLSRVGPRIARLDTNYRRSIPPAERLSICLRFLATGDSFRTIVQFQSRCVHGVPDHPQVATAIWDCLVGDFMAVPSPGDWRSITEGFQERWNLPLCCGALDGKHVQTKAPIYHIETHTLIYTKYLFHFFFVVPKFMHLLDLSHLTQNICVCLLYDIFN